MLILFVLIAVVGWAWRQRESLPFVARPLQMAAAPFEYGASRIMDSLASAFHIVDISLKNRIEWEALERENAELKSRTVDYDELVAETTACASSSTSARPMANMSWPLQSSFPAITARGAIR